MANTVIGAGDRDVMALVAALLICTPVRAAEKNDLQSQLTQMQKDLQAQKELIQAQESRIQVQQQQIEQLQQKLGAELDAMRGGGLGSAQVAPASQVRTVGEPPSQEAIGRAQVEAIPRELGVLTPKGSLVF